MLRAHRADLTILLLLGLAPAACGGGDDDGPLFEEKPECTGQEIVLSSIQLHA